VDQEVPAVVTARVAAVREDDHIRRKHGAAAISDQPDQERIDQGVDQKNIEIHLAEAVQSHPQAVEVNQGRADLVLVDDDYS